MAVSLKHAFQSTVPDGSNTALVRPSNWNAEHVLTLASGFILGRLSSGDGDAEEIDAAALAAFLGYSAAEVLALLLTVDGTGSGLDADLLDGQHASEFQPVDADLTAIAALSTTAFGRGLLELADDDALAALVDSFFLTPAEGNAAYQPLDADLTAIAALTTAAFGRSLLEETSAANARTSLGLGTANNPQFNTVEVGHAFDTTLSRAAAGVIAVEGVPIYSNIPQNSQSADYTLVLSDAQKHILHPFGDDNPRTFTIPANASVPFPIGTAITFVNRQNALTIAITSDTLLWAPDGTTGSRTLQEFAGVATAMKIDTTVWVISGVGLT